jgi:drug/metabolite transporter (DMT)-like permease
MSARHWWVFGTVCLLWGSMYIIVKKALPAYSVGELVAWRYLFAGLLFFPVAWKSLKQAPLALEIGQRWPWLMLIGVTGSFGPVLFTTLAQRTEPSSLAGMFAALTPIVTALFARAFLKERIPTAGSVGLIAGLAGAVVLVLSRRQAGALSSLSLGALWFVGACLLWAATSMIIRLKLRHVPSLTLAAWSMLLLMPVSIGVLVMGANQTPLQASFNKLFSHPLAGWFWLTVFMQMTCIALYNWLIVHAGPVKATAVTYVVPFVALAWGMGDGESLNLAQGLGLALVLIGLLLLNRRPVLAQ